MKARTVRRHFRESFKSLGRNGWMTFASVSAVTVTLLMVGVFLIILFNMNKAATDMEKDVEIRVHIALNANKQDEQELKEQIESMPQVKSVQFSSKEQELQNLIKDMGDEFKLFKQDNPLYDVFIVKTKNPKDTSKVAEKISHFDHTEKVVYGEKKIKKLFRVLETARNVSLVLLIGLLFTAMFLISNTIKMNIFSRRKEIEIMRLVGATNSFIRWPFLLEGLWIGILGSVTPIAFVAVVYKVIYQYFQTHVHDHFIQILSYTPFVFQVSAIILLVGVFIGMWGSFLSVRRFLKI
ncbi:permease-like cell division protein FtsX [Bacillus smithii]|uniref:permease-like cell division protein FtsX n=1 Tax=Bacillus smithii TaxID=1479 RepID=UPI002E201D18|nr:permease-like cell division protein FtsX [Bacillus smithii]